MQNYTKYIKIESKKENPEEGEIKPKGMHTFSETGAGVPAFLAKLWRLVEDPETNNLICWSKVSNIFNLSVIIVNKIFCVYFLFWYIFLFQTSVSYTYHFIFLILVT